MKADHGTRQLGTSVRRLAFGLPGSEMARILAYVHCRIFFQSSFVGDVKPNLY
jgi:hypothetical protein